MIFSDKRIYYLVEPLVTMNKKTRESLRKMKRELFKNQCSTEEMWLMQIVASGKMSFKELAEVLDYSELGITKKYNNAVKKLAWQNNR